jgi:AcrR family transcriptional regulator
MNREITGSYQDNSFSDLEKKKDTTQLIIEVAEHLFQTIGFRKTTVADIARELRMSPANIYRFFANKSEINEAVCLDLLRKIEAEAAKIALSEDSAAQRMRDLIGTIQTKHLEQYRLNRNLYDLIKESIIQKWGSTQRHTERMTEILQQIIASGMESGEFLEGDSEIAARLINTACLRFRDPRLILEYEGEAKPTIDQMIGFCLAAIAKNPVKFQLYIVGKSTSPF